MSVSVVASVAGLALPGVAPTPAPAPVARLQPLGSAGQAPALPATLEISYSFNKELHQIVFTLRRPDTGRVVRQVPPSAILEFAAYILRQTAQSVDAKA